MKFIAIIDESQLNDYEKWNLLFEGKKRNLSLKPISKEMLVTKDGESVYLSDGHIECFLDYEKKKILEEMINRNPIVGIAENEDTAEWKEDNGDYFCSNCGYKYSALDEDGCPIPDKYCPNCGARMKGDKE